MRLLLDASVLVAALVDTHPAHSRVFAWLSRARSGGAELIVASHTLAELYAVLTAYPVWPRIAPATAQRLISDSVLAMVEVVPLSTADYQRVIGDLGGLGVTGGAIYDALIARAASKGGAEMLVTLNADDFRRVAPEMAELIREA